MMGLGILELLILAFIVAGLLALFLLLAFVAVRLLRPAADALPRETPLEALRRRLAAGEITPEQFDELRRRLED